MSHKLAKIIKYNKRNYQASKSASSIKAHGRRLGDRLLHRSSITNVATGTFAELMKSFSQRVLPALHLPTSLKARRGPLQSCHPLMHILSSVTLAMLVLALPAFFSSAAHATPYSMTVSIDDSVLDMNVSPSQAGAFSKSSNSTVSVSTTNASGYTLSIASSNRNDGKLVDSNNDDNNTNYLSSITSATTEEQFKALDGTAYNNMWGYLPSKWDGQANTSYLPSPTATGDVLDHTTAANTTANTYTLSIGARVDATQKVGAYSDTYVILATANGTPYTITYKDNTLSNFPADVSATADGETVTISNQIPVRDGYTFKGWCTVAPTTIANKDDQCGGTTKAVGSTWEINQESDTNNLTLYAMWSGSESKCSPKGTTIDTISCMQDITSTNKAAILSSMTEDQQYRLIDSRDNQTYWVAKLKDGNIWMTQNLDLNLSTNIALTSDDTDLTAYGSGAYTTANGYSQSGGTITWKPGESTINYRSDASTALGAIPGWKNSNTELNSVDMGEWYWSGNYYPSGNCPSNGDNNYLGCNYATKDPSQYSTYFSTTPFALNGTHGHVGNYYNWTAAIATNDSSSYKTSTYDDTSGNPANSICPAGWRLPKITSVSGANDFTNLNSQYNGGATNTDAGLIASPLFLTRAGDVWSSALHYVGDSGYYWSSTVSSGSQARYLRFGSGWALTARSDSRDGGRSLRCLVR